MTQMRSTRPPEADWDRLAALLGSRGGALPAAPAPGQAPEFLHEAAGCGPPRGQCAPTGAQHLPDADAARIRRERCCDELRAALGPEAAGLRLDAMLEHCEPERRRRVRAVLDDLGRTAGRLARQNELNRHLAGFCLDLARQESTIFRDCVLDDPAGCYGRDARNANRGAGGVLVKQA